MEVLVQGWKTEGLEGGRVGGEQGGGENSAVAVVEEGRGEGGGSE